ncbi:MAG: hypothetical protein GDA46_04495 [Bdellovibrionales bacterium]|nr:hypothetical protein [Bdellovibrionales bacterium]
MRYIISLLVPLNAYSYAPNDIPEEELVQEELVQEAFSLKIASPFACAFMAFNIIVSEVEEHRRITYHDWKQLDNLLEEGRLTKGEHKWYVNHYKAYDSHVANWEKMTNTSMLACSITLSF